MELDLGLKLTSISDGFTSDFKIAKDRAGPVFVSRETDSTFFLTANLKGYKRRNIKIDINEDGSLIEISGEKQVQETVIVGWKVHKKEREIKGFKKVFRIPHGVILDKIKAKFDDESTLTVTMPKKVKGFRGTAIEEVKDKTELVRAGSGSPQIADEKSPKAGTSNLETAETSSKARIGEDESADKKPSDGGEGKPEEEKHEQKPLSDLKDGEPGKQVSPSIQGEVARVEGGTCKEDKEKHEKAGDIQEITEPKLHEDTYKPVPDEKSDEEKVGSSAIEEVKDKPELVRAGSGSLQIADEKSPKAGTSNLETAETSSKARIGEDESADKKPSDGGEAKPEEEKHEQKPLSVHDLKDGEPGKQVSPSTHGEVARVEGGTCKEDEEKHEKVGDIQEITEPKQHEDTYKQVPDEKLDEEKVGSSAIEPSEEASESKPEEHDDDKRPQRFNLCMPIVAGSTLLLTFVVFVIQMMRRKPQTCRRRD